MKYQITFCWLNTNIKEKSVEEFNTKEEAEQAAELYKALGHTNVYVSEKLYELQYFCIDNNGIVVDQFNKGVYHSVEDAIEEASMIIDSWNSVCKKGIWHYLVLNH